MTSNHTGQRTWHNLQRASKSRVWVVLPRMHDFSSTQPGQFSFGARNPCMLSSWPYFSQSYIHAKNMKICGLLPPGRRAPVLFVVLISPHLCSWITCGLSRFDVQMMVVFSDLQCIFFKYFLRLPRVSRIKIRPFSQKTVVCTWGSTWREVSK